MRQRTAHRRRGPVQRKLTVGAANDPHEREADHMARHVVAHLADSSPAGEVRRQDIEDEELMMKRATPRSGSSSIAPLSARGIQRIAMGPEGGDIDATTTERIESSRRGGRVLDAPLRRSMEGAFGADFSNVRVHTGATSDQLNSELGARAFTTGSDVFVRSTDYAPRSRRGQELLAHELTHVVQQGAARSLDNA